MIEYDWDARLKTDIEKSVATRTQRADLRRQLAARRATGLKARHQHRLDRAAAADQRPERVRRDDADDSWREDP
ncbi:MAG TPA: hypothetical protein VFC00_29010 [Micromonosporaceae bacterium]|nr:hypothetical protein [Micromonosporaceae bacterium]